MVAQAKLASAALLKQAALRSSAALRWSMPTGAQLLLVALTPLVMAEVLAGLALTVAAVLVDTLVLVALAAAVGT